VMRRRLTLAVAAVALLLTIVGALAGGGWRLLASYRAAMKDCRGQRRVLPGGRVIDQFSSETMMAGAFWSLRYRTTRSLDDAAGLAEEARQVWAEAQRTGEARAARRVRLEATDCAIHVCWAVWPPEARTRSVSFIVDRLEDGEWGPIEVPMDAVTAHPRWPLPRR
jgi:hypothetical protein